jgi:hypothetical protein
MADYRRERSELVEPLLSLDDLLTRARERQAKTFLESARARAKRAQDQQATDLSPTGASPTNDSAVRH